MPCELVPHKFIFKSRRILGQLCNTNTVIMHVLLQSCSRTCLKLRSSSDVVQAQPRQATLETTAAVPTVLGPGPTWHVF